MSFPLHGNLLPDESHEHAHDLIRSPFITFSTCISSRHRILSAQLYLSIVRLSLFIYQPSHTIFPSAT